ncbi:hypothetical protein ILYODFUR_035926 [Ilyodon furcidens]|uniref:Uncharacterized protein n=1 Tax=Ilyodon furcidens TaxID=33524 RepID=A0ABV0SS16_9TELE
MPEPPKLAPLDVEKQQLYSESLLDDRASHPISKGEPRHPAEETWRHRFSSRPLHTVRAVDHELIKPIGPHHLQKQRRNPTATKTDPLNTLPAPRNSKKL